MDTKAVIKGYKPLYSCNDGVFLYRKGKLYLWTDGKLQLWMRLFPHSLEDCCRLTIRLFRREPRQAVSIGNGLLLLTASHAIHLVDINKKAIKTISTVKKGFSDSLNILSAHGKWLALWGDYGQNPERTEVRIYGLKPDLNVETVYTFPAGAVRHVHNIIPKRNGGFYIFTGDLEPTAGIYEADESFANVLPLAVGAQKYRAVVGIDFPQGLVYGTDAVNEQNFLYVYTEDGPQKIAALNGSCIYGRAWGDGLLLSTTVEPDENIRGIKALFSKKLGKGILSNEVHLLYLDKDFILHTLNVFKKDIWPMKLMQYGSIQFADGEDFWLYPVAVKENEGAAILCAPGENFK